MPEFDESFELTDDYLGEYIDRAVVAMEKIAEAFHSIALQQQRHVTAYEHHVRFITTKAATSASASRAAAPAAATNSERPDADGEKVARGHLSQVKEQGEWIKAEFTREDGRRIWVATKQQNLTIPILSAWKSGASVVIAYTERQGNPMKEKPGHFYMDRYINKIEVVDGGTPSAGSGGARAAADDDLGF
jgi:hypothetical protein